MTLFCRNMIFKCLVHLYFLVLLLLSFLLELFVFLFFLLFIFVSSYCSCSYLYFHLCLFFLLLVLLFSSNFLCIFGLIFIPNLNVRRTLPISISSILYLSNALLCHADRVSIMPFGLQELLAMSSASFCLLFSFKTDVSRTLPISIFSMLYLGNTILCHAGRGSIMPFSLQELVPMSSTLRDVVIGVIDMIYPDSFTKFDSSYLHAMRSVGARSGDLNKSDMYPHKKWIQVLKVRWR